MVNVNGFEMAEGAKEYEGPMVSDLTIGGMGDNDPWFDAAFGDKVTVTGEIINYGGTIEFQYAQLTTDSTTPGDEGLVTIQSILDEAASLADKETLSGERTVAGTVKEITEAYTTQYKNISFILTDGKADILVFRSKGDCASTLKVGDKVITAGGIAGKIVKIKDENFQ